MTRSQDERLRAELDTQVDAFRQIVLLRSTITSLERELVDLKRRALQNVQKAKQQQEEEEIVEDREELIMVNDVSELLVLAREKFEEFDSNKSGFLDGDEMLDLADWVWSVFSQDGAEIRKVDSILAKSELITKCDKNADGVLDFGEFAEWFLESVNKLKNNNKGEARTGSGDANDAMDFSEGDRIGIQREAQLRQRGLRQKPAQPAVKERKQESRKPVVKPTSRQHMGDAPTGAPARRQTASSTKKAELLAKEPWRRLLKYKSPARNCIQLFLRLDRAQQNFLGQNEILEILQRCGVKRANMGHVSNELIKKFGGKDGKITLENFVDLLPANAFEKHIYVMVTDITDGIRETYE